MTAEQEREAVIAYLEDRVLAVPELPKQTWRALLWALVNPMKFGEQYGEIKSLLEAARAIERGDHARDKEGQGYE